MQKPPQGPKAYRLGALGELQGSNDSTSLAAKNLSLGAGNIDDECAVNGIVQIDAGEFTLHDHLPLLGMRN